MSCRSIARSPWERGCCLPRLCWFCAVASPASTETRPRVDSHWDSGVYAVLLSLAGVLRGSHRQYRVVDLTLLASCWRYCCHQRTGVSQLYARATLRQGPSPAHPMHAIPSQLCQAMSGKEERCPVERCPVSGIVAVWWLCGGFRRRASQGCTEEVDGQVNGPNGARHESKHHKACLHSPSHPRRPFGGVPSPLLANDCVATCLRPTSLTEITPDHPPNLWLFRSQKSTIIPSSSTQL